MKIEHIAFIFEDPIKAAKWYSKMFSFTVVEKTNQYPYRYLLVDTQTKVMMEIYKPRKPKVLKFRNIEPITMHLAINTDNFDRDLKKLIRNKAKLVGEVTRDDKGNSFAFIKDPWGFTLQLVYRND
jgi:hypothetical protein